MRTSSSSFGEPEDSLVSAGIHPKGIRNKEGKGPSKAAGGGGAATCAGPRLHPSAVYPFEL